MLERMGSMAVNGDELRVVIPGKAVPCPRPRVDRGHTHYPKAYDAWRSGALLMAQNAAAQANWQTVTGRCMLTVHVFGGNRQADWDNYGKAASDLAQAAGLIANDNLIDDGRVIRHWQDKDARMIIKVRCIE